MVKYWGLGQYTTKASCKLKSSSDEGCILVCCHNKLSQTWWLKSNKNYRSVRLVLEGSLWA